VKRGRLGIAAAVVLIAGAVFAVAGFSGTDWRTTALFVALVALWSAGTVLTPRPRRRLTGSP
jgi:hypothetical protein